jgi:hypothetical protein
VVGGYASTMPCPYRKFGSAFLCMKEITSWLTLINDLGQLLRHINIYGRSLERKQDRGNNGTT